jgi:SP family arabinose:H+ symporter-like MFS transporter
VLGINLIYFVNLRIASMGDEAWNIDRGWRYMLASGTLPAVLFFLLLLFVPESPRWLTVNGRKEEALDILTKVNGSELAPTVYKEILETVQNETGTLKELFKPGLRMAMLVGVFLAFFCQITGINSIIFYAPEIFKSAGFGAASAFLQTVIIGVVNTVFTFIAIWLIDKAGRRALLLWGVTGMIICLLAIGLCYHYHFFSGPWLLICILGYIASFASSLGAVPWVLISEIFPTKIRGVAMSFATVVLWVGVLLITQLTPVMLEKLGGARTFFLFMVNAVILLVFTWKKIPETRQRSLEEIEKSWTQH